jgi:hypothetical protein
MSANMPALIIPPIANSPEKVQLARVSHVYLSHPNLNKFYEFARDFGMVEAGRVEDIIYYRGFGKGGRSVKKLPKLRFNHFTQVALDLVRALVPSQSC